MGIVSKQSIQNTLITYVGFSFGAVNALFLYTHFLGETYYGLTAFLLSSGGILMPLMAFGAHNTIIKYFPLFKTEQEKSGFLTFMLFFPLILILPLLVLFFFFYTDIALYLSRENPIIYDFFWMLPILGLLMGYFEVFYAWVKVHFQSVFGGFIKEILIRVMIMISLYSVHIHLLTSVQFVFLLVVIYGLSTVLMMISAFWIRKPIAKIFIPKEFKAIFVYSAFIILSGSVAAMLIDIDRFMISQFVKIENVAYYSVAVFIAAVVAVPSRAMHQITHPITARLMANNQHDELNMLYKQTSINLQFIGGFIFLGILVNIQQIYLLIPDKYEGGISVVFLIGFTKYFDLVLGNNNAIIFNSTYYRSVLLLGVLLLFFSVLLNSIFIPKYGINGAAVATLISLAGYSMAKLFFVVFKLKLFPFSIKNAWLLLVTAALFFGFYYWDFSFHPMVNILLKSILVTVLYVFVNYKLNISEEINKEIGRLKRKITF